jgi:hypothetical protein
MDFPTTQTIASFIEEQQAAYQLRIDSIAETPRWIYTLQASSEFNDSYRIDLTPMAQINEGRDHLFEASFQFTGSAQCGADRMSERVAAMQQAIEYFSALVKKLNSLGGWTPFLEE